MTHQVVIGIGNPHRRDDGIGPAVAAALADLDPVGLRVISCPAEPTAILDGWAGSERAVLVDAAVGGSAGRIRTWRLDELAEPAGQRPVSSHDLSLRQTWELGRVLGRAPETVVVVSVDVCDTGHGAGLSPAVAAALPEAVRMVCGMLGGPDFREPVARKSFPE